MKRREFIINSAILAGGATLLGGCNKKELIKSENQITRRKYKDITVPLLALGCMRLPMRGNNIDMEELDKMVEYCMQKGANYFDTAYMYVNSQSEIAMGKVLKKLAPQALLIQKKNLLIVKFA